MKKKMNYVLLLLSIIAIFATIWVREAYGKATLDQIIFHMQVPVEGTTSDITFIIIYECFIKSILVFIGFILLNIILSYILKDKVKLVYKKKSINIIPFDFQSKLWFYLSLIIIGYLAVDTLNYYDVVYFAKNTFTESKFIENNYIDPNSVDIKFPKEKKNLIYIYVESLESTYVSKELGGSFDKNLIPNLYNFAIDNTSFSHTQAFGGLYQLSDTGWTIAGMVSQTAGIPLKVSTYGKLYSKKDTFLNNATTLGDILEKEGYNQTLLIGSDAVFGGRKAYFTSHGNYEIRDYVYAKENGRIDDDYYVFWGYEDSKLFEFAKEELNSLKEPFNLTMLTVDNHTPSGYLDEKCSHKFDNQIESVINCTDLQLYNFVNWIKEQPFYENTTIVIVGDHLNMDGSFIENKSNRRIYNVIINGGEALYETNRMASSFDMFPTTLASLNVQIEGNRLGLGTNLYSNEPTIIEKYGLDYVNDEINKKSLFYDKKFLFN